MSQIILAAYSNQNCRFPAEITRLTGIHDELVRGQHIDVARLELLIERADLIIAHNARFDRPFCEALSPAFAGKAWACSLAEINWRLRGCESRKLGDLLAGAGYFHVGHRALDDCIALLEVLAGLEVQNPPFCELYLSSQRTMVRIYAEGTPYSMKDHLKTRGYRWSDGTRGRPKSWWTEVPEEALDSELRYLRTEIYRSDFAAPIAERITGFARYKAQ